MDESSGVFEPIKKKILFYLELKQRSGRQTHNAFADLPCLRYFLEVASQCCQTYTLFVGFGFVLVSGQLLELLTCLIRREWFWLKKHPGEILAKLDSLPNAGRMFLLEKTPLGNFR